MSWILVDYAKGLGHNIYMSSKRKYLIFCSQKIKDKKKKICDDANVNKCPWDNRRSSKYKLYFENCVFKTLKY